MAQPRRALGRKIFGGIVVLFGALLIVCSILFFAAFGTGERGEARTVWQGCLAGVTVMLLCDIVSKRLTLPINTITALMGIPIVIFVVVRNRSIV